MSTLVPDGIFMFGAYFCSTIRPLRRYDETTVDASPVGDSSMGHILTATFNFPNYLQKNLDILGEVLCVNDS